MPIPVNFVEKNKIVRSFSLQDIAEARRLRDELIAKGVRSYLTRSDGTFRYGGGIHVWTPTNYEDLR